MVVDNVILRPLQTYETRVCLRTQLESWCIAVITHRKLDWCLSELPRPDESVQEPVVKAEQPVVQIWGRALGL